MYILSPVTSGIHVALLINNLSFTVQCLTTPVCFSISLLMGIIFHPSKQGICKHSCVCLYIVRCYNVFRVCVSRNETSGLEGGCLFSCPFFIVPGSAWLSHLHSVLPRVFAANHFYVRNFNSCGVTPCCNFNFHVSTN